MARETARLRIDRLVAADIDTLLDYRNDPEVAEDQGWALPWSAGAAARLVEASVDEPVEEGQLALRLRDGTLIGDVMAVPSPNASHAMELGISLRRSHWGHGYASEALEAVVDALFESPAVQRVAAYVSVRNRRSQALFDRLGFRREGLLASSFRRGDGELVDEVLFATVRERWRHPGTALDESPHPADVARVLDGVDRANMAAIGRHDGRAFAVFHRDRLGGVVAGATGFTWAGIAHLDALWVTEALRGRGLGAELVARAENVALARGATAMMTESHTFAAPELFERLGYTRLATVAEYPPGHGHVVLRKELAPPAGGSLSATSGAGR